MTAITDIEARKLDIGRVVGQTFTVIGRQWLFMLALAVLAAVPGIVNLYAMSPRLAGSRAATMFTSPVYWFDLLLGIFLASYVAACLFYLVFSEVSGRSVSLAQVAGNGLRKFLPLFIVNLLSTLAIAFASLLLIVPGILLGTAWCVAGPASVAERIGVFAAFGRSAELTRNNRWRIFGLFVIWFVVLLIIEAMIGALNASVILAGGVFSSPSRLLGVVLVSAVTTILTYTGLGVLYADLRELKEGVDGESLAAVFG